MLLADVVATSAAVGGHPVPHGEGGRARRAAAARPTPTRSSRSPRGWPASRGRAGSGVGWRTLPRLDGDPAAAPSLTVAAVDAVLAELADDRRRRVHRPARRPARRPVRRRHRRRAARSSSALLTGELRQGALEGVMLEAVAAAAEVPAATVRRAFMLSGRLPATAAARADRRGDGARRGAAAGRPAGAADARRPGRLAGRRAGRPRRRRHRRVQARRRPHPGAPRRRRGPGLDPHAARDHRRRARAGRAGPGAAVPLGGARRRDPRARRRRPAAPVPGHDEPLRQRRRPTRACCSARSSSTCLHLDGSDLLDEPLAVRLDALAALVAGDEHAALRMPGVRRPTAEQAAAVLDDALAAGHEGVVVKALDAAVRGGPARARRGRRSSRCTPSTSSCSARSGATGGAPGSCPTSTSAPAIPTAASRSWSARRSRA